MYLPHIKFPELYLLQFDTEHEFCGRSTKTMARQRPDNAVSQTADPEVKIKNGVIVVTCATEGAVIGWTADAGSGYGGSAAKNPLVAMGNAVGNPEMDGRSWQLYHGPIEFLNDRPLWFQAQRLGYLASEQVIFNHD